MPRCATCQWFDAGNHERALYDGRCVRYPPAVHFNSGEHFSGWPDVMDSNRCGEWRLKLVADAEDVAKP